MRSFDSNRAVGMFSDIMSCCFIQSSMPLIACGIARDTEDLITEVIERIRNCSKFFGFRPSAFTPMCCSSSKTVSLYVADRWSAKEDQALCLLLEIQVALQWPVWLRECTDEFTGTQKVFQMWQRARTCPCYDNNRRVAVLGEKKAVLTQ